MTHEIKLDVDDAIEAACRAAEIEAMTDSAGDALALFVRTAAKYEQSITPEDVIARRLRVKQLDDRVAARIRPLVEAALKNT